MHQYGQGTDVDYVKAQEFYRASGDDPNAAHNMAYLIWQGQGAPQSYAYAQKEFKRLMNCGYPGGVCTALTSIALRLPTHAPHLDSQRAKSS